MADSSVLLDFREKVGSGNESIDMLNGKFTATRIFQGPYLDRIRFVKTFLNKTSTGSIFGGSIRFPFQEHPRHKGLYATSADIKGKFGADKRVIGDTDIIEYKTAIVTIKYQALPFAQPNGGDGPTNDNEEGGLFDFIEETSDASLEILQIPGEDITCDGKKQFDGGPQNHVQVFLNINLRQPFVAKPHWDQIMQNLGKVNRKLFFTPAGKVAPKGTVVYHGPSDRIKIDALAPRNFLWDISHKFVYNRTGWHNKWCEGGFKELNPHIFEDGDLMQIFFGQRGGGPAQDLMDAIQVIQDLIDAKQVEIDAANAAGNLALALDLINEQSILIRQRNRLIENAGGSFLAPQPGLED